MRLLLAISLLAWAANGQPGGSGDSGGPGGSGLDTSSIMSSMQDQTGSMGNSRMPSCNQNQGMSKPNIIFFLADDLGWNDVSWHNPDLDTPRMQELADTGVILERQYAQPVCSPSRATLFTGKFAHKIGMQHNVLGAATPECLHLDERILSNSMKMLGYTNHYLGKWHLGYCDVDCTPQARDFDTFYGFYNGYVDHYTHMFSGNYDWRDGTEPGFSVKGEYATDLITARALDIINNHDGSTPLFMFVSHATVHTPVQTPPGVEESDDMRTNYLSMLTAMDTSIGATVDALKDAGLYDNSIIIFASDNGGEHGPSSNHPLRGEKATLFEGGTRSASFVHSPLLENPGRVADGLEGTFHFADWHPTIYSMAGGCVREGMGAIDGMDLSGMVMRGETSLRTEFIYQLDQYDPAPFGSAAIRMNEYKLIWGYPGLYDGWDSDPDYPVGLTHVVDVFGLGATGGDRRKRGSYYFDWPAIMEYEAKCNDQTWLYNVIEDPEERTDIAADHPDIVEIMKNRITNLFATEVQDIDLAAMVDSDEAYAVMDEDPDTGDLYWAPGWCDM